jgi:RNA polymerase sigma factor (sigma-70 family)
MRDFQSIYKNLSPRINYIAAKLAFIYSKRKPLLSKEDLYQEMCLWLWEHYQHGVPPGINDAYIIQGCRFHIQNFIRKTKEKCSAISLDQPVTPEGQTLKDFLPDPGPEFRNEIEANLLTERIEKENFSTKERKIFFLLKKDYTTRQIGKKLNISHVMVIKYKKKIAERLKNFPVTR